MALKIALIGNPNCGKTTMFNSLTGSNQYVGNWPGVTVEKKEGKLKNCKDITLVDLPGIYSLSPYTSEEIVSRDFLLNEKPQAVINIVDATNIERNLYLTSQVLEVGIPVVIALNFMDVVEKEGIKIDIRKMSEKLGCRVMATSALKDKGLNELVRAAAEEAKTGRPPEPLKLFSSKLFSAVGEIEDVITENAEIENSRYYAIKLFERDAKAGVKFALTDYQKNRIEDIISERERELDDDSESLVINDRYEYITKIIKEFLKKPGDKLTVTEKIDRIVTNRYAAIPIFLAVMAAMYAVSITFLGSLTEHWMELLFDKLAYGAELLLDKVSAAPWLYGLLIDGIIGGVGAVLTFVPQLMILFLFLSFLEDCGYMSRVAFILDRLFRKFGLSGKSFIPMLVSSGCGVSGIMATRTIENDKDRRMTIMLTTFIPCGAKIPVITMFASAIIGGWFAPVAYLFCVLAVVLWGFILKHFKFFKGDANPFVMELPPYRWPGVKSVLKHMWERSRAFIVKAGTVILLACAAVWFLGAFTWKFRYIPSNPALDAGDSILASIGRIVSYLFIPLGFGKGNWQAAVATLSGFVAKENVVGTLGVMLGGESDAALSEALRAMFSTPAALSFVCFTLLSAPCVAAISAIKREMRSVKWMFITIGFQTAVAYATSLVIYQVGSFVTGGSSAGTVVITAVLLLIFALIAVKIVKDRKKNRCCGCKDCPVGGCCGKSDCGEGNAENQADKDKED